MDQMEQVDPQPRESWKKPIALLICGLLACAGVGTAVYLSYEHNLAYQNSVEKTSDAKKDDSVASLSTQAAALDGAGGISIGQGDQVQGTSKQRQTATTSTAAPADTKPFALPHPSADQSITPDSPTATANCQWPNSVNMPNKVTGLLVGDVCPGSGKEIAAGMTVKVNYHGMLLDGTAFDSSYARNTATKKQPFEFTYGKGMVIKGWDQGMTGMKVGGKRLLVIPPDLAYGSAGSGKVIPPNATLVFMIELLSVK